MGRKARSASTPVPSGARRLMGTFARFRAAYTNASPLEYFERARETRLFHPKTGRQLTFLLQMLAQRGERETFRFIRTVVLTGQPFCE